MHYLNGFLAVATSNGDLMLFQITENNTVIDEVSFTNISCRPTCLVIFESKKFGMDFDVKQDEEDGEVTVPVVKPEKVRKTAQTKGTITVEFEVDEIIEQRKTSGAEVTRHQRTSRRKSRSNHKFPMRWASWTT
jgi:hypothetical protein